MTAEDRYCYLDGRIVPEASATLSPFDRGFIYGDAVYEVIPVFWGQPFAVEEHLERLGSSLADAYLRLGDEEDVLEDVRAVLSANAAWLPSSPICRLGIWISRGVQPSTWKVDPDASPTVFLFCWPVDADAVRRRQRDGLTLVVATRRRVPEDVLDPRLKMTSRLPMALAEIEATPTGDLPLLLDHDDRVTETSTSNVFLAHGRTLVTAPRTQVLEGVTRRTVIRIAREAGYEVEERDVREDDCMRASEAFTTSSSAGIVPVRDIVPWRAGLPVPGPVTRALRDRVATRTGFHAHGA